jgi:hypothetical protein
MPPATDRVFGLLVGVGFLLVAGYLTAHHEPYRDEMQAWLLARDSATIGILLGHMRYEGHPPLWQLLLYLLQRTIGTTPTAMQVLNLLFASGAVATLAAFAPFSRGQRALFAAGFFPLYMYGVIARDYALTLLCVLGAVALVPHRHRRPAALALVLLVLAWTTVFGLIFTLALLAALWTDPPTRRWCLSYGLVVLAGAALSAWQMHPPADSGYAVGWHFTLDPARLGRVLVKSGDALFPFHGVDDAFWAPPLFESTRFSRWLEGAAAVGVLGWGALAARRSAIALWFYGIALGGLLSFFYFKYLGDLNHHGFVLVTLVATLWLAAEAVAPPTRPLTALLLLQALAVIVPGATDARQVFSNGRAVAAWLQRTRLDDGPLVGYPDYAMASVLGFLPRRSAFFPGPDREGTFTIWDQARLRQPGDSEIVAQAESLAAGAGRPATLIVTHAVHRAPAEPLASFVGGYAGADEDFYLYRVPAGVSNEPAR